MNLRIINGEGQKTNDNVVATKTKGVWKITNFNAISCEIRRLERQRENLIEDWYDMVLECFGDKRKIPVFNDKIKQAEMRLEELGKRITALYEQYASF